jgi:hypothetical protein
VVYDRVTTRDTSSSAPAQMVQPIMLPDWRNVKQPGRKATNPNQVAKLPSCVRASPTREPGVSASCRPDAGPSLHRPTREIQTVVCDISTALE